MNMSKVRFRDAIVAADIYGGGGSGPVLYRGDLIRYGCQDRDTFVIDIVNRFEAGVGEADSYGQYVVSKGTFLKYYNPVFIEQ